MPQKISYTIEEYNPEWSVKFIEIKSNIEKVFKDKALTVQHVGSTSIVGMKAKPLIDVLVTVKYISDLEKEIQIFIENGYECKKDYIAPDSLYLYKIENGNKVENIHVCIEGSEKATQLVLMRDYLIHHSGMVEECNSLKERLKVDFPDDYELYRDGKKKFLDNLEKMAQVWVK